MCGIAGLIYSCPQQVAPGQIEAFSRSLEHRGPDDRGFLSYDGSSVKLSRSCFECPTQASAVFVHRRLSILDLTEAGWQPMGTPDGRYYIVFNGEIYNYCELRELLETEGYEFRSNCDTEVLLYAFSFWRKQVFNKLVGMFSFAILDTREQRLFLARDPFGIKPLYYTFLSEGIAFGSEIETLLTLPDVVRRANPQRVYDYLVYGMTDFGEECMIQGIYQMPAAHVAEISLDNPQDIRPQCYWEIDLDHRLDISFSEAANKLRDLFVESVRMHLRSDVSVGTCLSGGIDSSAIVSVMRHLDPRLDIHTFSYVAEEPGIDEEKWVDIVTAANGAIASKVRIDSEELVDDIESLLAVQEEPFASTSIYCQQRVFRLAKEMGTKVLLDGQGADELLGGYPTCLLARYHSLRSQGRWFESMLFAKRAVSVLRREVFSQSGLSYLDIAKRCFLYAMPTPIEKRVGCIGSSDQRISWIRSEWFRQNGVTGLTEELINRGEGLRESLYKLTSVTNLPALLRYEDRNSMCFSIESRVPFITTDLFEFVFSLPEEFIIAEDLTSKHVFREALRGIVPNEILARKDKIGFATPEESWFKSLRSWVDTVLSSETARGIPVIDLEDINQRWQRVCSGEKSYTAHIWRWVNLIKWTEHYSVRF